MHIFVLGCVSSTANDVLDDLTNLKIDIEDNDLNVWLDDFADDIVLMKI